MISGLLSLNKFVYFILQKGLFMYCNPPGPDI